MIIPVLLYPFGWLRRGLIAFECRIRRMLFRIEMIEVFVEAIKDLFAFVEILIELVLQLLALGLDGDRLIDYFLILHYYYGGHRNQIHSLFIHMPSNKPQFIIQITQIIRTTYLPTRHNNFIISSRNKMQNSRKMSVSSYSKYKCQYKQKSILTKLSNDSGYPQDILAPSDYPPPNHNYIQQNKMNLKNFFQERIPPENTLLNRLMKRESELIHPKKMFEMKQAQYELKNKTKMNLKKELEEEIKHLKKHSFDKVNSSFHVNDKNKELRQKYGGKINLSFYEEDNHRRGTHSHINKRSKIMKKEAYDKVFGPDISSLSRTAIFSKTEAYKGTPPRAKSISIKQSNTAESKDERKNIKELISKLKQYKSKLEDQGDDMMFSRCLQAEEPEVKDEQENLILMIKNMTNLYKKRNVDEGYRKVQKLQDVGKLNQQFYAEMVNHKNNRLHKRMQLISNTIDINPRDRQKQVPIDRSRVQLDGESILSFNQFEEPDQNLPKQSISGPIHSVHNRFKLLKRTLVRWAALFFIYGIKKSNIYIAFQASKQPYHLEGSYVFFKCIKLGDIQSVKNFITKNYHYLYEVEFHGKSPLSYACVNNQVQIASLFLQEGVNSDKPCSNKKTSLFYALQTRNVELIQLVLQKGASPWSTPLNPYSQMINAGQNADQISNLFNNARKIYLGMQIQSTIHERKDFWNKYKAQIRWNFRIDYTFFTP